MAALSAQQSLKEAQFNVSFPGSAIQKPTGRNSPSFGRLRATKVSSKAVARSGQPLRGLDLSSLGQQQRVLNIHA